MSRFTSFIVFTFGLFLIGAVSWLVIQKYAFPPPAKPAEEQIKLPECSLATLETGTREDFERTLDELFESGGMDSVKAFVEKEFVPGRMVHVDWPQAGGSGMPLLVDREIRKCNLDGVVLIEPPPILPRLMMAQIMGEEVFVATWQRVDPKRQFVVKAWFLRAKK